LEQNKPDGGTEMTGTRLNDCTPTPDEEAKYADGVTDEREAALQTFARMNEALARVTDERDAARAEIARLREVAQDIGDERHNPVDPPEADVMEIAWVTLGYTADPAWIINDPQRFPDVHAVARALTAYGDQRARTNEKYVAARDKIAREARQQMLVDSTPLREAVAREARAAALEEAWNAAGREIKFSSSSPPAVLAYIQGRADAQKLIRTLADTPPQSEGGEG
jgi:hypothetical protein